MVAGLIAWVDADYRAQRRSARRTRERGVTRRSARAAEAIEQATEKHDDATNDSATRPAPLAGAAAARRFLALAALFLFRLFAGDPSRMPSALIGRPAPQTDLPPLAGLERDGKPVPGIDPATSRAR